MPKPRAVVVTPAVYAVALFAALLVAGAGWAGLDAASLGKLSTAAPEVTERVSAKKDVGIDGIKGLDAVFIVDANVDDALATLWDVEAFPELFPDIDHIKVVRKEAALIEVRFAVDTVLGKYGYTTRRILDRGKRTITWRETDAGDLKYIRGRWSVTDAGHPDFAKVTYTSFVDVGYAVPTGMVRDLAIDKVGEMADRVRGACRKRAAKTRAAAAGKSP